MDQSEKLFKVEVLGIYETRARSFEEAYAQLEVALDNERPIVLKSASTAKLKVAEDGRPYPYMRAVVGAFARMQIEQMRNQV